MQRQPGRPHPLRISRRLFYQAERGRRVFIYCEKMVITVINNGSIKIANRFITARPKKPALRNRTSASFSTAAEPRELISSARIELRNGVTDDFPPAQRISSAVLESRNLGENGTILVCWQDILCTSKMLKLFSPPFVNISNTIEKQENLHKRYYMKSRKSSPLRQ